MPTKFQRYLNQGVLGSFHSLECNDRRTGETLDLSNYIYNIPVRLSLIIFL